MHLKMVEVPVTSQEQIEDIWAAHVANDPTRTGLSCLKAELSELELDRTREWVAENNLSLELGPNYITIRR